jgi:hypothetical protein
MGHGLIGHWVRPDLAFDLLGMCDYAAEMKLLCKEASQDAATQPPEQGG